MTEQAQSPIEAIVHALYNHIIQPDIAINWLQALTGDGALAWPDHLAGWVQPDLDDCDVLIVDFLDPNYLPF